MVLLNAVTFNFSYILAVAFLAFANFIIMITHVVYYDDTRIIVKGVFKEHLYETDNFERIEFAEYLFEQVYFIRFKDGRRFLIATKEMSSMSFGGSDNPEKIANQLTAKLLHHYT